MEKREIGTLFGKQDICKAINGRQMPVIVLDLADTDEFGLVSKPVVIHNGSFRDGFPWYIHSQFRFYTDNKYGFTNECNCLTNSFTYYDMEEILKYRNAPVIEADEDVILAIIDSHNKVSYMPLIFHTKERIDAHCITPLNFENQGIKESLGRYLEIGMRNYNTRRERDDSLCAFIQSITDELNPTDEMEKDIIEMINRKGCEYVAKQN